jgi:hypothetical protein
MESARVMKALISDPHVVALVLLLSGKHLHQVVECGTFARTVTSFYTVTSTLARLADRYNVEKLASDKLQI